MILYIFILRFLYQLMHVLSVLDSFFINCYLLGDNGLQAKNKTKYIKYHSACERDNDFYFVLFTFHHIFPQQFAYK
jgi:hypothetical protein